MWHHVSTVIKTLRLERPNKKTDCTLPFFFGDACCVRKEPLMYSVGIDWADQKHNVCILAPDRRVLSEFTIKHDWSGFEQLRSVLNELKDVEINLERSDGLLVDWLVSQNWRGVVTPPTMSGSPPPQPTKDDRRATYLPYPLAREHYTV